MLTELFPISIYRAKVESNFDIQSMCMGWVEEEYEKNPTTFSAPWDNDIFTTYGKDVGFSWQEILPLYMPNFEDLAKEMNISGQVSVNSAWVNAYKSNQSHDLHDHLPCQFSAVHYLKYNPEVHTSTIFVNPYRQVSISSSPRHESFVMDQIPPMWHPQSTLDVEEGDILIFPSFFEHRVARQTSDELRVTISFNFNFI